MQIVLRLGSCRITFRNNLLTNFGMLMLIIESSSVPIMGALTG